MKKTMIILICVLPFVIACDSQKTTTIDNTTQISRGYVKQETEIDSTTKSQIDTINVIDSLKLSEYDQVYWWSKYWGKQYGIPHEVLLSIAWKETGWGSTLHWVPIESYSVKKGGRMDMLNAACNGTMQVIMSTATSMAKLNNIPIPTREQMRYDIKTNIQIASLLVKYLWIQYGNIIHVFNAYNSGNPSYGYGSILVSHLKTKYNLDQKQVEKMFQK